MIRTIHTARYVLTESGILMRNAAVHVSDPGRISRLEPWQSPPPNLETRVIDWGCAIILPGLVNTHCHLELTGLRNLAPPRTSFTNWLSALIMTRRDWTEADYTSFVKLGARMSLDAGTPLIGDISASGISGKALGPEKLRKVVFEEAIGLMPEKASEVLASLNRRLDGVPDEDSLLNFGLSPHAPYSVSPELYRAVTNLAQQHRMLLATHVAETADESELLRRGRGKLAEFLTRMGALPDGWVPPGQDPIPYLAQLGALDRPAILVHCNYVDGESMALILNRSCSVVYCPRSHAYFGFDPHPVRQMLDMGINVALGTDSLASNDSLSLLDEMRFLFRSRKDLRCDEILRMATLNGAVALGFGGVLGRLRRGYWADMTVLRLPENIGERNVIAQVLEGAGECMATIVQGEIVRRG